MVDVIPEALWKPVTPAPQTPPLHGLLASVPPLTENDDRWQMGLIWVPELCNVEYGIWEPCPVDALGQPVDRAEMSSFDDWDEQAQVVYRPFTVEMESGCSSTLMQVDLEGRATRQIEAITPKAVEGEFWDGTISGGNFSLVTGTPNSAVDPIVLHNSGATVTGGILGQNVSKDKGLAMLATALAKCAAGSRGTIHAQAGLVEAWTINGYLKEDGPRLITRARGDLVIAYTGGSGKGPHGAATDLNNYWAYATGPLQTRLSDPAVYAPRSPGGRALPGHNTGAFTHRLNQIRYRVTREAAVTVDPCCSFAVQVDLT